MPLPAAGNGRPHVVVGADASHWGRIALRWAAEHAWLAGAELAVYTSPRSTGTAQVERGDEVGAILRGFPLLPVQVHMSRDATNDLLLASRQADLVVLGCRGSDHLGIGLGATVTPVAAGAECDVMVIGGHPAAVRGAHHQTAVLVGMDADEAALDSAARLAALRRVPLRILIAAPMMGPHPTSWQFLSSVDLLTTQANPLPRIRYEGRTYPIEGTLVSIAPEDQTSSRRHCDRNHAWRVRHTTEVIGQEDLRHQHGRLSRTDTSRTETKGGA